VPPDANLGAPKTHSQAPPFDGKAPQKKTIVVEVDDQVDGDVLASLTERDLPEGRSGVGDQK
jgi:hypothetical protein